MLIFMMWAALVSNCHIRPTIPNLSFLQLGRAKDATAMVQTRRSSRAASPVHSMSTTTSRSSKRSKTASANQLDESEHESGEFLNLCRGQFSK